MKPSLPNLSPAILHVVLRPRYSGAEMLVKELIPLHIENGSRTAFCSLLPSEPAFTVELQKLASLGCKLFVPDSDLKGPQRVRQIAKAIRAFKPDLIVAHSVIPAAYSRMAALISGWTVFPRQNRKLAIALHAAENDDYELASLRLPEKILTYFADSVITVSEEGLKNYRLRIRSHPVMRRIANGIDLTRFRKAAAKRNTIRDQLDLEGQRLVLQVGRLSKIKQQRLTLEAMIPLLRQDPKLLLWFAGLPEEPAYEAQLRHEVQESGLSEQIRILGSRTDVPELLAAADVYVMPSTMEAHSVALIEALASGVPVVASSIPSFLYAASFPAVSLVGPNEGAALARAVQAFLGDGRRHDRDLDAYDIAATEKQYRNLINE